jgi:hypothetical protein
VVVVVVVWVVLVWVVVGEDVPHPVTMKAQINKTARGINNFFTFYFLQLLCI